jgi:hypothetical protein
MGGVKVIGGRLRFGWGFRDYRNIYSIEIYFKGWVYRINIPVWKLRKLLAWWRNNTLGGVG